MNEFINVIIDALPEGTISVRHIQKTTIIDYDNVRLSFFDDFVFYGIYADGFTIESGTMQYTDPNLLTRLADVTNGREPYSETIMLKQIATEQT